MIIAVDGSAASGKGTLAKRLATHFELAHLDTGSLYRMVGLAVLEQGLDDRNIDEIQVFAIANDLDLSIRPDREFAMTRWQKWPQLWLPCHRCVPV